MRKLITVLGVFAALTAALSVTTTADNETTINATITPANIVVSVDFETLNYGVLPLGATQRVPLSPYSTNQVGGGIKVDNGGNVPINVEIRGEHTQDWQLAGAAGHNQYVHRFSLSNSIPAGNVMTIATKPLVGPLQPNVEGVQMFVNLDMPTTSTAGGTTQTAPIILVATAAN